MPKSVCPECKASYSPHGGGHCRGGAYGGCCKTFSSDSSADAHFTWASGTPRCLNDQEMAKVGFHLTERGWSHWPAMSEEAKAAKRRASK